MTGGELWTAPGDGGDPSGARPLPSPRYRRLGSLGSGSMGTVHLGWDAWLERNVALKVPVGPPGSLAEQQLAREATLAARLEHPSIAAIHDMGRDEDGRTFFVMRLVRGRTLQDVVTRGDRVAALRAIRIAADAVAHAHERRVVHRDLSPSNVLVGTHGDVAVIDWGVAAETDDTQASRGVGTPGFVAPEQAAGAAPGPRADVWSLGALLRFAAGPDAPPELQAVVARATSASPDARYPDATSFAADLAAWEDGRRVSAFAYAPWDLFRRVLQAWRVPIAVAAASVVALTAQGAWSALQVRDERDQAVAAERRALDALAASRTQTALAAWRAGDEVRAARLADEALALGPDKVALGLRMATAAGAAPVEIGRTQVVDCPRLRLTGSAGLVLCLHDDHLVARGPGGDRWTLPGTPFDARVDGDTLHVLDNERRLRVVDLHTGVVRRTDPRQGEFVHAEDPVRFDMDRSTPLDDPAWNAPCPIQPAVARGADGSRWSACSDGAVWRRLPDGTLLAVRAPGSDAVDFLAAVGDGMWAATHHGDILRLDAAAPLSALGESPVRLQRFPGSSRLLVHGRLGRLRVLDTTDGRWVLDLDVADAAAVTGPDTLVTRHGDALVDLRLPPALPVRTWRLAHGVSTVVWDDAGIVAGDSEGRVHRLDPDGVHPARSTLWQYRVVKSVDLTPDGGLITSALGWEGMSRLSADLATRTPLDVGELRVRRVVARADGTLLGSTLDLRVARIDPTGVVTVLAVDGVRDLEIDEHRQQAVVATDGGVWSIGPDDTLTQLDGDPADFVALHDGALLRGRGDALTVRRGSSVTTWRQPSDVTAVRWVSADRLVTGGADGMVRVFAPTGELVAALPAHDDRVGAIAVSPDHTRVVSAGWDGRVQVLSLAALAGAAPAQVHAAP